MAESAAQARYIAEYVAGFEMRETLLRKTVTTAADIQGSTAIFLVADSGGATATTRGLNGLIPGRADNLVQYTATLQEWHDKPTRSDFNIYTSQGDGRRIMQETTMGVVNRQIDSDIITELNTATQTTGAAVRASLTLVMYGLTILGNQNVPLDGNISALITPGFYAYLMQSKEFTNVDYVNNKPFTSQLMSFRWAGVNFIVHPTLPGKATTAEKCFMYHKTAIGHACDTEKVRIDVGHNAEHGYSWAHAQGFMGSKILQNAGIVVMNHDGGDFAAQ